MAQRKIGVISDIHSNLEALTAVLQDASCQHVTELICLGDVVGYGADPKECLRVVRQTCSVILKGNHDDAVSTNSPHNGLSQAAREGVAFSRAGLTKEERVFLGQLPLVLNDREFEGVHSSLYLPEQFPYIMDPLQAEFHFSIQQQQICFCGHTHHPVAWEKKEECSPISAKALKLKPDLKYLVNVGSVGQPRDRDPRASYVIYTPTARTITFRRINYPASVASQKMLRSGLSPKASERLIYGI